MMTFLLQPACEILLVTGMAEQGRTVSLRGMHFLQQPLGMSVSEPGRQMLGSKSGQVMLETDEMSWLWIFTQLKKVQLFLGSLCMSPGFRMMCWPPGRLMTQLVCSHFLQHSPGASTGSKPGLQTVLQGT